MCHMVSFCSSHLTFPAGAAAELALTARDLPAAEAAVLGLVSKAYSSTPELMEAVMKLAAQIAAKSPLAVAGTKAVLLHTRWAGTCSGAGLELLVWDGVWLVGQWQSQQQQLLPPSKGSRAFSTHSVHRTCGPMI